MANTAGFAANFDTLEQLGSAIRGVCYDSAELVGRLRGLKVSQEAFGTRPKARAAYLACTQTVATETDRIYRQTQALAEVAEGVKQGLTGFRGFDKQAEAEQRAKEAEIQALQTTYPGGY